MNAQSIRSKREFDAVRINTWLPQFNAETAFRLFCVLPPSFVKTHGGRYWELYCRKETVQGNTSVAPVLSNPAFLQFVSDAYAKIIWPAFGIRNYYEGYSRNDPVWLLARIASLLTGEWWLQQLLRSTPVSAPGENFRPKHIGIRDEATFRAALLNHAQFVVEILRWQPTIDCIRKRRCFEDYSNLRTPERMAFERDWYHRRAATKVYSYEALFEPQADGSPPKTKVLEPGYRFEDDICGKLDVETFVRTLSELDAKILRLRMYDYTLQEIAQATGFATHSAVKKRMDRIKRTYLTYDAKLREEEAKPKPEQPKKLPPLWIFK